MNKEIKTGIIIEILSEVPKPMRYAIAFILGMLIFGLIWVVNLSDISEKINDTPEEPIIEERQEDVMHHYSGFRKDTIPMSIEYFGVR